MFLKSVWEYAHLGRRSAKRSHRSKRLGFDCLGFENLEKRVMLSAVPPTVTDVAVSSTDWSSSFLDYLSTSSLGTDGYSIPVGSSNQTKSLPWENIDQIKLTFSEDVNIDVADLSLSGINNVNYQYDNFFYDAFTHVATWTLSNPLVVDRLMLDLDADGIDSVTDLDGNILDGEWIDDVTSGPSGNGTAGGDFEFSFNLVPGDVDQNQYVTYYDYVFTRAREGQNTSGANYTALHDIDGSGLIDTTDWMDVLGQLGSTLPTGQPAGATNDAPTTSGIAYQELNDPAVDVAISLFAAFDDVEDTDSQLTYAVVGNTTPSLLDTLSINSTTGILTMSAASSVSGTTTITVRATDSQGLSTETGFEVDVDHINQPPVIVDYLAFEYPGNTWLFTGYVTDPDDDVEGWIVEFEGVFEIRATVDENGYFEFAVILDENDWGLEWAVTEDPHGLESNSPAVFVGLT